MFLRSIPCLILISLLASPMPLHGATPDNAKVLKIDPVKPVRWLDDLGLNDSQKVKLREIWKSKRETVKSLRAQILDERERLKILMSGEAKAEEVTASYRKIRDLQAELNEIDLQSMLAVREMLTLVQRAKFVEHMSLRGRLDEENPRPK